MVCAHVGRAVEDIPAGAVVAEDVVVVVGEALEVRAEFEGVLAVRPGDVVERLNDLAALHAGVARAGGHESVDEHLRRFRPVGVGLGNGESGLREQRGGGVALRLGGVLRVEAAAKLVEQAAERRRSCGRRSGPRRSRACCRRPAAGCRPQRNK